MFSHYKGLRREMYVLFFGRIVTNMGALIWPMLTLILTNKLGYSASQVATIMLVMTLIQIPFTLIGGKLADHFNKRNIIIFCDLITVTCYFILGFIEVSFAFVVLFFVAGLFASIEWPCYDALVADLSTSKDREKAYSLNYLGANIGLVLAPTIGGFLFENYLNIAFVVNAISTLSSTILIYIYIKDVRKIHEEVQTGSYEESASHDSIFKVIKERKMIMVYLLFAAISGLVYSQFNFLMPLNLERLYGAKGAIIFGLITSVNACIVIIGTPLLTKYFPKVRDVSKLVIGEILIVTGLAMYIFIQGLIPMYFVSIFIFTIGEIFSTLGKSPYLTRRIPASHRGRIVSISMLFASIFQAFMQKGVGFLADSYSMPVVWGFVCIMGVLGITLATIQLKLDKKMYPLLYTETK
ncbi:MFS transporter [Anaerorhabdus furcosa]|uniref:Major Facilitator Superfamily protein n=1 Tax=Anaerorhabdus furcosa TaxID=118967 RepID=A0A1T4NW69_9FIRM|nr:MFS transporter [Anaerorhabdus furcosa]SJZ83018.1 Major Facilitator Superfamily protein [Anaerorhabdus furcosa]